MLENTKKVHELECETDSYCALAIEYINTKFLQEYNKNSLIFTAYLEVLQHQSLDIHDFYKTYENILNVIEHYLKAISYILDNQKEEIISMKHINIYAKAKDLKNIYEENKIYFDLVRHEFEDMYDELVDVDTIELGTKLIENIIKVNEILDSIQFDKNEYIEVINKFAHTIHNIGKELELGSKYKLVYFLTHGLNKYISSMCIGSEFMKELSSVISGCVSENLSTKTFNRDYDLQVLSLIYGGFNFEENDRELKVFDI